MGTSWAFMKIFILSICKPDKALIKCSIVDIFRPYEFDIVVLNKVSETLDQSASITLSFFLSTRINLIPLSTFAGSKVNSTRVPVCRPIPFIEIDWDIVC